MAPSLEHIPAMRAASNRPASAGETRLAALAAACSTAALEPRGPGVVDRVLGLALEAFDAERAFVIHSRAAEHGGVEPVVEAQRLAPALRRSRPSRTVALRALEDRDGFVSLDPGRDRALIEGRSIRSLRLRWVLAAPLAERSSSRRALVVDSRCRPVAAAEGELLELARAFAALIALGSDPVLATGGSEGARLAARSADMAAARAWIERIAPTGLPVLIHGESGSGKEVVARTIHDLSSRRTGPFLAVSCTELPETLVEAELFGSERGAYTGAERDRPGLFRSARGGTLLLDEIGDMPLPQQAKLLRVLQEKTVRPLGAGSEVAVDVRLLTATHRDLRRAVREGTFRGDLYYRLCVTEIVVPPLRRRVADLPLLVEDIGTRLARETGLGRFEVEAAAMAMLRTHDWPGNVRELQSVLARALLRSSGRPIEPSHLVELTLSAPVEPDASGNLEARMIRSALDEARGSPSGAARLIGWTRQKLYRRMTALSLR